MRATRDFPLAYLSFFLNGKRDCFLDGDCRDFDPDLFSLAIESYWIGRVEERGREREGLYLCDSDGVHYRWRRHL